MRWHNRLAFPAVIAVLCGLIGVAAAVPAAAHSGGKAVAQVRELVLEPKSEGAWDAKVEVVDGDSGDPILGINLQLEGSSNNGKSFESVRLKPTGEDGWYGGVVAAAPGEWSITVTGKQTPGGEAVRAFSDTHEVTLAEDSTAEVVGNTGNTFLIAFAAVVVALVLGIIGLFVWLRTRSRRMATAVSRER